MSKRLMVLRLPDVSTFCVEVSPAKTCQAQARALALQVIAAAYGENLIASSGSVYPDSSSSKTSLQERKSGWISSCVIYEGKATKRFRSRLKRLTSGHSTGGRASSFSRGDRLPTLTNARNKFSPDSQRWPAHRALRERLERTGELPTLTAQRYGTAQNGNPGDGREAYATRGNPSLHSLAGAPLNPPLVRMVHGVSGGVDGREKQRSAARRHALGNSVVPWQAEVIGHVLIELFPEVRHGQT